MDAMVDIIDAGSNTISGVVNNTGHRNRINCIIKKSDVYNTPLVVVGEYGGNVHVQKAYSNDGGALFYRAWGNAYGPIALGPQINVQKLFANTVNEPNSLDNMYPDYYAAGSKYPYLKAALSGAEGIVCLDSGFVAPSWKANTSYMESSANNTSTLVRGNGSVWQCTAAGTSGAKAPAWPGGAAGVTVDDNGVTWTWFAPAAQFAAYGSVSATAIQ